MGEISLFGYPNTQKPKEGTNGYRRVTNHRDILADNFERSEFANIILALCIF